MSATAISRQMGADTICRQRPIAPIFHAARLGRTTLFASRCTSSIRLRWSAFARSRVIGSLGAGLWSAISANSKARASSSGDRLEICSFLLSGTSWSFLLLLMAQTSGAVAGKGNGQKPLWANVSPAPDHPRSSCLESSAVP